MSTLFRFPNPVNEVSARLVAGGVVLMALVAIGLQQSWLLIPIAYGFWARALTGPTLSPLGQLVTRVLTPRLPVAPRFVPGPPKRFAQSMGVVVSTLALVLSFGFGQHALAFAVLGLLAVFAILESVFAYCVGCKIFGLLMAVRLIPEHVCVECADISWRSSART